jgi:thymidylate synthase (FAD)
MAPTTLKVTRIAETNLSGLSTIAIQEWMDLDFAKDADLLAEMAGRACYQSFDKPNSATSSTEGYVAHILEVGHYSVLAHASVSYYITGVSRSLTHELVRSRWPAFSQLSQRYVTVEKDLPYVVPPLACGDEDAQAILDDAAQHALRAYHRLVAHLTKQHPEAKVKRIREAARAVLPGMTETRIVVSANLRAWRDLLAQRLPEGADAEIRELAALLLVDLKSYAPHTFSDFEVTA